MTFALETESRTFERLLPDLLRTHPHQYVLIHGDVLAAVLPDEEEAIAEGYRRFGGQAFLVKRVEVEVPLVHSSALVRPRHAR